MRFTDIKSPAESMDRGFYDRALAGGVCRALRLCSIGLAAKASGLQGNGQGAAADGKPLSSGIISFVPKGDLPSTPSAQIGSDGTFSVVTGGSGEGAPSGEYKVRIEAPELASIRRPKKKSVRSSTPTKTVQAS